LRDGASEDAPGFTGAHSRSIAAQFTIGRRYDDSADLRGFGERNRAATDDPATAYYVSQALEECAALRPLPGDRASHWIELAASAELSQPCRGFDGAVIEPREIVELLSAAARRGEPHAVARMLLFRDIAAPKADVMAAHDPRMAQTRESAVSIARYWAHSSRAQS
jgi:hypothetical protein